MSLAIRLKLIRESLGYVQKEMGKAVSVSLQMWQAYEAGKSVPGGNVLEALARLGFNVNWILTGLGSMWVVSAGDVWSEKFRALRGDLSIPEFVEKLKLNDPDNSITTIQAIENKKLDPDLFLLTVIVDVLGISLDWFLGWHDIPMLRADRTSQSVSHSNVKITLLTILDAIESAETSNLCPISSLSPKERTALIYAMLVYAEDLMDNCELSKREIYSVVPLAFSIVKRYEEMQESAKSTDKGIWETNLGKLLDAVIYVFGAKEI